MAEEPSAKRPKLEPESPTKLSVDEKRKNIAKELLAMPSGSGSSSSKSSSESDKNKKSKEEAEVEEREKMQ